MLWICAMSKIPYSCSAAVHSSLPGILGVTVALGLKKADLLCLKVIVVLFCIIPVRYKDQENPFQPMNS